MKKYVTDTSVIVERLVSKLLSEKKIKGQILIPNAVIAELEHQENKGQDIGFSGLEEIQELRKKIKLEFIGERPSIDQIKLAKSGEIDALIIDLAVKEKAHLITADLVQAESGKAFGLEVIYFKPKHQKEKLEFEKYFDETTMSIHIMEGCHVSGKKGKPGEWELKKISKDKLKAKDIQDMSKEILEKVRIEPESFVEISRRGSTVVQYKNYRIVIVRPPISDGWEITIVRPMKKLSLEDYKLSEGLSERLKIKARGILISGEPGSGKSTFAQALGEFYLNTGKIVKTVESPRDLQLPKEVTQYSKNFTTSEEIHDILFLSRPDHIIFDEMRDTPDFELYSDLRLSGSECVGVVHSSSPIDSVQRFISRMDVGTIPSVIDTIIFVDKGQVSKVLNLNMLVKVPSGMTESDLARPIIEVRDFESEKLEYEIYSYGEQTVVIPITKTEKKKGVNRLAEKSIKQELLKLCSDARVEIIDDNRAEIYVPKDMVGEIIGKGGKRIEIIEKKLGISLGVNELEEELENLKFDIEEDKKLIKIHTDPGYNIEVSVDGEFIFSAISSKKGVIKVHKKSNVGRELLKAIDDKKKIEVKGY
jgi:ATPase